MLDVPQKELKGMVAQLHREGEERAAQRLAEKLGLTYADLAKVPVSLEAVRLISEDEARRAKAIPIEEKGRQVALAALDPTSDAAKKVIEDLAKKNYQAKAVVVSASSLEGAWKYYEFVKPESKDITGKVEITKQRLEALAEKLTTLEAVQKEIADLDVSKAAPAAIMEILLAGAMALHASDIHTEAEEKKARVRFRVDGLLHDVFSDIPLGTYRMFVTHIKLLSRMKLNIKNAAQDGRFTIEFGNKEIEMRVSVIPAEFGETIVMRVLDPSATLVTLPQLGLREDLLEVIKKQLARPNGLILNTGPTGSGKTTTLYAFLRTLNDPTMKIITLEDPIEYRLEGIEQTQVEEKSGYTFANGLRAIVRQDPDVILVGEIRDLETGDIALQAALTGHLVLSTLHTNDAIGAVPRLINLGVKPVSIGPALSLAIAQRLVRVLCPECKKQAVIEPSMKEKIEKFIAALPQKVNKTIYANYTIYEPAGCDKCNGIGYKGRVGIFEFLEGGPDLEATILREASEVALREVAKKQEMVTMQQDGVLKVLLGTTTLDEVSSVTGEIAW